MWIKTQRGGLVNTDRLLSISVVADMEVWGVLPFGRSALLGVFDTRAEADAYFDQLANRLTGGFDVTGEVTGLDDIRDISLEGDNHDG